MFTVADIREIAVQIERNGEAAYRQAAQMLSDPAVSAIFTWMAEEEKRHGQWFSLIGPDEVLSEEQQEVEKMGRKLLQQIVADQTFSLDRDMLLNTPDFDGALAQAQTFEQDTILFYEFLSSLVEDEGARRQLQTIIEEEKRHLEQLAEIKKAGPGSKNLALV